MKKSLKRILAIICCVAVVLTGISVDNLFDKGVQAAEASATSVMSLNIESVNNMLGMATGGFLNIPYTGVASDYAGSGGNFLDAAFAEKYITFDGGMTYEDLSEGLDKFYVANNSILQMNWATRTTPFTDGWSFTIAAGALLPYRSTNGTAYMALDREYTFTFANREGGGNLVRLTAYYVTSFGMKVDTEYGNGLSASTVFELADAATNQIKDYRTKYTYVYNDSAYADYIDISGYAFSELDSASVKLRYILDNGTECFQFENWGNARNTLTIGDQIILREGLPIYYTGTDGYNYKALLDGTYVYECVASNAQHNQVFVGMKYDSTKNVFGINTNANGVKTVAQSATNLEQYVNIVFDSNSQNQITDTTATTNILGEMIAEEYIQIADYTVKEASALGMVFRFIPSANVLQLGFGEAAVDALEVGDQIILKAGMPIVYKVSGSKLSSATLDNSYAINVLENDGTNMTLQYVLTDTYGLSGVASKGSDNGYASSGFMNMLFNEDIPTGETFQEVIKDAKGNPISDSLLKEGYFTISGYTYDDLKSVITLKAFNISALRAFRFVYTIPGVAFEDGDVAMWKAGLPISYNVSAGGTTKHKTIYLDKDYGFVYNGATSSFVYDSSLVSQPEEPPVGATLNIHTQSQQTGSNGRTDLYYTSSETILADAEVANILSNEKTANYIDMCGVDTASLISNNVSIKFIPSAACLQIVWGDDLSWVEEGGLITFTAGMPIYYTSDNAEKRAVLEKTAVYEITDVDGATIKVEKHVPTVKYELATNDLGTGLSTSNNSNSTINILNAETGANNVLDDAARVYSNLSATTIEEYVDFFGMTSNEMTDYGVTIRFIKDGAAQVLQILWGTSMDAMQNGDELVLKKGLPFTYTTQGDETKKIVLNKDYTFVVHDGNATNTKILKIKTVQEDVIPKFTFRTESALTGADGRTNLYYTPNVEIEADNEVNNILTNDETAGYIDMCGVNTDTLLANGVKIKFIPADSCFQIAWGSDLSWVKVGDIITFKEGMPIHYVSGGDDKHAVLQKTVVYEITSINGTVIQVDTHVEKVEYKLDTVPFGTGNSTTKDPNSIIKILDPKTGANNLLDDANRTYAPLSTDTIANYVDVCGLTAQEIQDCGMSFRFIRDGGTQVLQILWGTSASELEVGSYLIFRKGLPFTYTTTDGSPKTVVLDKDYIFEATGGNATHTRVFNYVTTTAVTRKEWSMKNGAIYNTARGTGEGYYNNISLETSELTEDLKSLRVTMDAVTLAEYVDFAGIDPSRYVDLGIQALVVIDGNTKVVQLRWGETTSLVKAGDEIIFKKGMPITITQNGEKTVYELDADYVFTISKHTDGANGYRITTSKIDDFNVVITVDGVEVLNGLYKTGTELDLEQYRNTAAGRVMSIQVNGVTTQNTSLVVAEDTNVVILNRSDICIVVFKDEGVVVATREYLLTDENVKLPYAPDKDGYDDSWEKFELKNGVIYVNAIHTLKASTHPTIKLSGVVIEETDKPANNSNATSPQTGDGATTVAWIVVSAAALMFVILKLAEKNKARKER